MPDAYARETFNTFRASLGQVRRASDLGKWFGALQLRIPADHALQGALSRWQSSLKKADSSKTLWDLQPEWGDLFAIAMNLLHQATGDQLPSDREYADSLLKRLQGQLPASSSASEKQAAAYAPRTSKIEIVSIESPNYLGLFSDFRRRLESVKIVSELRDWMAALQGQLPESNGTRSALIRWRKALAKADQAATVASLEQEWGNLYNTADNLLHNATGQEKSFDPTWSESLLNVLRATRDAVSQVAKKGAELAETATTGAGWLFYLLPVIGLAGVGIYAYSRGKHG